MSGVTEVHGHDRRPDRPAPCSTHDSGSLAVALLLTLVGVALSGLLVSVAIVQTTTTGVTQRRTAALDAAQSGLDVGMDSVAAATTALELPCDTLTGTVVTGGPAFEVSFDYFTSDPRSLSDAQVAGSPARIACANGAADTPAYALLRSVGKAPGKPARTLRATYVFRVSDVNTVGGLVHVHRGEPSTADNDWCLDAGAATAGTTLQVRVCDKNRWQQRFAYNADLTLSLPSSRPEKLCLDAGGPTHATLPAPILVKLQACATSPAPQQQWIYNGSANLEGTTDGNTPDGFCINVQHPDLIGSAVVLVGGGCGQFPSTTRTWYPDPAVGTGSARSASGQLVNFGQYGRCLTVPASTPHTIADRCGQAWSSSSLPATQRWVIPTIASNAQTATGPIVNDDPAAPRRNCLKAPGADGGNPTLALCPTTPASDTTWTLHGGNGPHADQHTIIDHRGRCLAPIDQTMTVATCDGSALQKWNAPPYLQRPLPLQDISE